MTKKLFKSVFLISLGLFLFCLSSKKILAQASCNGICDSPDDYALCPSDCDIGDSCATSNCPGSQPSNVCCRPGVACPEGNPTWTYAYDAQCKVDRVGELYLNCSWHWQYQYCSAADKCGPDSTYLYAGICDASGCTMGGIYKTCCQNGQVVPSNCPGSATCPAGSTPTFCGFDQYPACGQPACSVAGPTPTPGGPAPTSPPAGGERKSNTTLNCPLSVTRGQIATLTLGQYPYNIMDLSCYFQGLPVTVQSGPQGGTVCGYDQYICDRSVNPCAGDGCYFCPYYNQRNCAWNTSGWPIGSYRLQLYYPGHTDPGCQDDESWGYCNVQVVAPTATPTLTPTPTPSCVTGSWETVCGYAGNNWCAAGTASCDSGWVDQPQVWVSGHPVTKLTNSGTYCSRWDGKKRFTGTVSAFTASCGNGCNAPCTSNLQFSPSTAVPGQTINYSFSSSNAPNTYLYYRRSGQSTWTGPLVNSSWFTAPAAAGTYEAILNGYNSACNAFCNSNGDFYTANVCPATSYIRINSGCGGASNSFTVVIPTATPTLPPGVTPTITPIPTPTPTPVVCQMPPTPAVSFIGNQTPAYQSQFTVNWQTTNAANVHYKSWWEQGGLSILSLDNECMVPSGNQAETRPVGDNEDVYLNVKVDAKNFTASSSCNDCKINNNINCCISSGGVRRCSLCGHPTNIRWSQSQGLCSGKTFYGTDIFWTDVSQVENGFVIYRCLPGVSPCPSSTSDYNLVTTSASPLNDTGTKSYLDCDYPYGTYQYNVRCYTNDCTPLNPPITSGPTPTTPPSCPLCPTPVQLTTTLKAGSTTQYNLNLTWADINSGTRQEGGYKIYRCLGPGCAKPVEALTTLSANTTSYTDTNSNLGFNCGTSLSYWIVPTKSGCVEPTCVRNETATPACPGCIDACPGQPPLVSPPISFNAPSNTVTLQWSAPSSWGIVCPPAVANNRYFLYVSTTNNGSPIGTLNNASGLLPGFSPNGLNMGLNTTYTLTNLIPDQWYYWQVRAENK